MKCDTEVFFSCAAGDEVTERVYVADRCPASGFDPAASDYAPVW